MLCWAMIIIALGLVAGGQLSILPKPGPLLMLPVAIAIFWLWRHFRIVGRIWVWTFVLAMCAFGGPLSAWIFGVFVTAMAFVSLGLALETNDASAELDEGDRRRSSGW